MIPTDGHSTERLTPPQRPRGTSDPLCSRLLCCFFQLRHQVADNSVGKFKHFPNHRLVKFLFYLDIHFHQLPSKYIRSLTHSSPFILDGQLTLFPAFSKMILASATTHLLEEHISGFRSIDSKVPSRSITKLEKAIKVRVNSLRLTG